MHEHLFSACICISSCNASLFTWIWYAFHGTFLENSVNAHWNFILSRAWALFFRLYTHVFHLIYTIYFPWHIPCKLSECSLKFHWTFIVIHWVCNWNRLTEWHFFQLNLFSGKPNENDCILHYCKCFTHWKSIGSTQWILLGSLPTVFSDSHLVFGRPTSQTWNLSRASLLNRWREQRVRDWWEVIWAWTREWPGLVPEGWYYTPEDAEGCPVWSREDPKAKIIMKCKHQKRSRRELESSEP